MDERSQRGSLLSPVDPSLAGEVKGGAVGGDSLHGHWGKSMLVGQGQIRGGAALVEKPQMELLHLFPFLLATVSR